jgi:hypothetical protein
MDASMSVTSSRNIDINLTGDEISSFTSSAVANVASPGQMQVVTLASGANTITCPTGGTVPTCCTILKPSGNATLITLKGVTGDTGVKLHLTDPDSVSLDSTMVSFCLTAAAQIVGVRLIWT